MNVACRLLLALMIALTSLSAMSPERAEQSSDDTEIRIGNLMPSMQMPTVELTLPSGPTVARTPTYRKVNRLQPAAPTTVPDA